MNVKAKHKRAAATFSIERSVRSIVETLENRWFLHGDTHMPELTGNALVDTNPSDGHISAARFLSANPQFAGKDLFSPATFNPTNSGNRADWLYDPHGLENDLYPVDYPDAPTEPTTQDTAMPDLVPLTGSGFLSPFISTTEIAGHSLLRFTTAIGNQGNAPAVLQSANSGTPPAGTGLTSWVNSDGTQNVLQRLYSYTPYSPVPTTGPLGSYTFTGYRQAGRMVYHAGHGHFHLEGYASYRLLNLDGSVAMRTGFDNAPAVGEKVGFCLVNILDSFTKPDGSSSTTIPGYDVQGSQSAASTNGQPQTTCGFLQGIHVGHADVYDAVYDGQWIDVTGVATGDYKLEVTLDALNVIQESDENNNSVMVDVHINNNGATGGVIQPDRFEPNNSFAQATNLGVLGVQTQPGLTCHVSSEPDFFKFTAASSGLYSVQLTIADKDVNLYVYDAAQTLIGSSTSPLSATQTSQRLETVTTNFVAGQMYYVRAVGFGSDLNPTTSAVSANYALSVSINPTVNAATPDNSAAELGLSSGIVSIARNGPTSGPLTVSIGVSGTATRGVDYALFQDSVPINGNTIILGNEASVANLEVRPIGDGLIEATETIIITVTSNSAYVLGSGVSGQVNLSDTPPQVTASAFAYQQAPVGYSFDFTLNVGASLDIGDIIVRDSNTHNPVTITGVLFDSANNRARFTFANNLPNGNYEYTLLAAGVTHAQGAAVPADLSGSFFVLNGDANRDRSVNIADFALLAGGFGSAGNYGQGDFNYDGTVNIADFAVLAGNFGANVPAARAALTGGSVGTFSALPPRSPFATTRSLDLIDQHDNRSISRLSDVI